MITPSNPSPSEPGHSEIVSTRIFDAPRETVFGAFENTEQLVHWWGPKGFTNTIEEFDLRPGGAWRFMMHGPDGTDYDTVKDFVEVAKPEKIVVQHRRPMHRFQMEMTYADESAGQTRLTWRMVFEVPETENVKKLISEANEQNFDRLAAFLERKKMDAISLGRLVQ